MIPFQHDQDPSAIGQGIVGVIEDNTRITQPMVRKDWRGQRAIKLTAAVMTSLLHLNGMRQSALPMNYLELSTNTAIQLFMQDLMAGPVPAGSITPRAKSIGFLNVIGGYTRSVNSYGLRQQGDISACGGGVPFLSISDKLVIDY